MAALQTVSHAVAVAASEILNSFLVYKCVGLALIHLDLHLNRCGVVDPMSTLQILLLSCVVGVIGCL